MIREEIDNILEHLLNEASCCEYQNYDFSNKAEFRNVPLKLILFIINREIEKMVNPFTDPDEPDESLVSYRTIYNQCKQDILSKLSGR